VRPINYTYMMDLDVCESYGRSQTVRLTTRQKRTCLGGFKRLSAKGETHHQDLICVRRVSTHIDGISYAMKSIGAMNMYLLTQEGRDMYGTQRHHGKLTDDWDLCSLIQVTKVNDDMIRNFVSHSAVFSGAGKSPVTHYWLACQNAARHKRTKRTVNEGEYVGFALMRFRYMPSVAAAASVDGIQTPAARQASNKRHKSQAHIVVGGVIQHRRPRVASFNGRGGEDAEDDFSGDEMDDEDHKYAAAAAAAPVDPPIPVFMQFDQKDVAEELNHQHFWQLVPYISPFADGLPNHYFQNQYCDGRLYPCGMVMETYAPDIVQNRDDADHGRLLVFPWQGQHGHTGRGWVKDMPNHIKAVGHLSILFGQNARLYN
jgi:hypothetical protein